MTDWREALQDAMYPVLTRLLQEGFVLPLFVTCIGRNGSMMCGRYDDIEATGLDFIFEASHIEDEDVSHAHPYARRGPAGRGGTRAL